MARHAAPPAVPVGQLDVSARDTEQAGQFGADPLGPVFALLKAVFDHRWFEKPELPGRGIDEPALFLNALGFVAENLP